MEFKKFNDEKDFASLTGQEMIYLNMCDLDARKRCGKECLVYLVAADFNKTGNNKIIFFVPNGQEYNGYIMTGGEFDLEQFDTYKYDEINHLKRDMKWICGTKTEKAFIEKINDVPSRDMRNAERAKKAKLENNQK